MTKHEYKPRIADQLLFDKLRGMGAVLIEGPKWYGKNAIYMPSRYLNLCLKKYDCED